MADRYWVGGSGQWSTAATTNWATTSGGASGASAPTATDNVIFDANSGAPLTVNSGVANNMGCLDLSINVSGVTIAGTGGGLNIAGSLTLNSGTTFSKAGSTTFTATTTGKTVTTNGVSINTGFTFNGVGGGWTLGGALTTPGGITVTAGTFDTANYNLSSSSIQSTGTSTRAIVFGSSTVTVTGSGATTFSFASTGLTITGTGTFSATSASAKTFAGGGVSFASMTLNQGGAGALTISGSNTFKDITNTYSATGATTITFTSGTTTTLTQFSATGAAAKVLTLGASTTSAATLSAASGIISVDYMSISYSTATGGATWYAGANSTNGGNNTGWVFTGIPASTGNFLMFF